MGAADIMVTAYVLAGCLLASPITARYVKRASETECSRSAPCGWQVYDPETRNAEIFVQSPCECPELTECVQTRDNIAIYAYVYNCRLPEEMPYENAS